MRLLLISGLICCTLLVSQAVHAARITIDDVPSYTILSDTEKGVASFGCAPTAAAMIIGYWDLHGYGNLFGEPDIGKDIKDTGTIKDYIDPTVVGSLGYRMGTSLDGLTKVGDIADAITNFAYNSNKGYWFPAKLLFDNESKYLEEYLFQIDTGNPVLLNVDSNNDGTVDHSVTGIGYDDRGEKGYWYGFYDAWEEEEAEIQWHPFTPLYDDSGDQVQSGDQSPGTFFTISSMCLVRPHETEQPIGGLPISHTIIGQSPVPEPTTFLLFTTGLAAIALRRSPQKRHFQN